MVTLWERRASAEAGLRWERIKSWASPISQMNEVTDRGKRVTRRDAIGQKYGLSSRQAWRWDICSKTRCSRIEDYEKLCPEANKRTLQRDIKSLVDKGVLKAEESARLHDTYLKSKAVEE